MALLANARPAGRAHTHRRLGAVTKPGLLTAAAELIRRELVVACGPTLVGPIVISCWPPYVAHDHVDEAASDPDQRALTHALLTQNPTWFFVVGTATQLWPQLHGRLS